MSEQHRYSIQSKTSVLPVTALEFLTDSILLASNGGALRVYNTTTQKCLVQKTIFRYNRIHGIQAQRGTHKVLVFGSKQWAVLNISDFESIEIEHTHSANDWIKAGHWVQDYVALALAHNQVAIMDMVGEVKMVAQSEPCILYSAMFYGATLDSLVVAAGTVFNQVIVWRPIDSTILYRLKGHTGVVFGIRFSSDGQTVSSVSDDRTVRLWRLPGTESETLFGHRARVWVCLILNAVLVSASEDGTLRVWDRDGAALDVWTQCKKNVWALAANPSQTWVASGGGDGSVWLWNTNKVKGRIERPELGMVTLPAEHHVGDFTRAFALKWDEELVTTDSGHLLRHSRDSKWSDMCVLDAIKGYSAIATSLAGDLVAVGMRDGQAMILTPNAPQMIARIHKTTVRHLTISEGPQFDLVTVDANNQIVWSRITGAEWQLMAVLELPSKAKFASVAIDHKLRWAAVGSVRGSLYLFDTLGVSPQPTDRLASVSILQPTLAWFKLHSKHSLSTILFTQETLVSASAGYSRDCAILTGGRDGLMHTLSLRLRGTAYLSVADSVSSKLQSDLSYRVVLEKTSTDKVTEGWVERLFRHNGALLAVTFFRKRLVLLDLSTRSAVLSVACAGGAKQWQVLMAREGIRIGFIRKAQLAVFEFAGGLANNSSVRLAAGISSLDIRSIAVGPVVAVGGDDGYLRTYCRELELIAESRCNVIRCIEFLHTNDEYLVSGGCGLQCWRIDPLVEWAQAPGASDSRVMAVSVLHNDYVAAAYSNSMIRLWHIDIERREFAQVAEAIGTHCFLSLKTIEPSFLVSGATNGQICFWRVGVSRQHLQSALTLDAHQSGVNCLDVMKTDHGWFVASGGDDNSVTVWEIISETLEHRLVVRHLNAHASSVQRVFFVHGNLCSMATDQRIAIWAINNSELELLHMSFTQVADPSTMVISSNMAIVGGIGVEVLYINKSITK
ncbi:WD repeat-containing protein 6 [Coemansia spiralis]|uniref:WD repeat-containing protein 6 n=2 Tax=Coemansia TaxID=4863 RepID=A0A9W8KXW0_9FUNG|nr:WD repeat-containing protein 6 [Coemansia umbellata]KAJ2626131.1 WD repeat-containing protein 6 [Coemansia sp. RSA 1358]KAJ2676272.1 WD repeat-containing protein 6 [Coemansia spiralis]